MVGKGINSPWQQRGIVLLISLLLFLPPFFRGLYFEKEFFVWLLAALGIFVFAFWTEFKNNQKNVFEGYNDYAALGLVLAYGIAIFGAVNPRDALGITLKMIGFFLAYYMATHFIKNKKEFNWVLNVLYGSSVVVALIGLVSYMGIIPSEELIKEGRIYSTLQYPNTLASYLTATYIMGLFLISTAKERLIFVLYGLGNYIIMLTIVGTQSRGAFLVLPVVLFLMLIGPWGRNGLRLLLQVIYTLAVSVIIGNRIFSSVPQFISIDVIGLFILGCILTIICFIVLELLNDKLDKLGVNNSRSKATTFIVFIVVLLIGIFVVKLNVFPQVTSRIQQVSLQERNVQERVVFYSDALKVVKHYPLIGAGGGAWKTLFTKYQSYGYATREVHNHYLQVWLETGMIGLIFMAAIWLAFIRSIYKSLKKSGDLEIRIAAWTILCASLAIGIHSTIDFNLSLGAIGIFLWTLFGLARVLEGVVNDSDISKKKVNDFKNTHFVPLKMQHNGVMVISIILFLITLSGSIAISYGVKNNVALNNEDVVAFESNLKKAISFDPLNSPYHIYLAQIYAQKYNSNGSQQLINKALEYSNKAVEVNEYDPTIREIRARILLSMGRVEDGVREMEKAMELNRWSQERWDMLAETYFEVGRYYLNNGEKEKAKQFFGKAEGVPDRISKQLDQLKPQHKKLWETSAWKPVLSIDDYLLEISSNAKTVLKKV